MYWMQNQVVAQNYAVLSISEAHALQQNRNTFLNGRDYKMLLQHNKCLIFKPPLEYK